MEYKKLVVRLMLGMRMVLFIMIAIIGAKLYYSIWSSWQFLGGIFFLIIILDICDGSVARTTKNDRFIFYHRCLDGIIDKTGNVIALIGFFSTGRVGQLTFTILLMRELLLLLLGGWAFNNNQIQHIRGDISGKIYYLLLALFVFLNFPSNVQGLTQKQNTIFMTLLSILMFINIVKHGMPFMKVLSQKVKCILERG